MRETWMNLWDPNEEMIERIGYLLLNYDSKDFDNFWSDSADRNFESKISGDSDAVSDTVSRDKSESRYKSDTAAQSRAPTALSVDTNPSDRNFESKIVEEDSSEIK